MRVYDILRVVNPYFLTKKLVKTLNPVKVLNPPMTELLKSLFERFVPSVLKSFVTALIGGLALLVGAPAPTDQVGYFVWAGFLSLIRALIGVLERLIAPKPAPPTA